MNYRHESDDQQIEREKKMDAQSETALGGESGTAKKQIGIISKHPLYGTTIEIDGLRIPNVRAYSLSHIVGEVPVITLEIISIHGYEIEGEAHINETTALTQDSYVRTFVPKPHIRRSTQ